MEFEHNIAADDPDLNQDGSFRDQSLQATAEMLQAHRVPAAFIEERDGSRTFETFDSWHHMMSFDGSTFLPDSENSGSKIILIVSTGLSDDELGCGI